MAGCVKLSKIEARVVFLLGDGVLIPFAAMARLSEVFEAVRKPTWILPMLWRESNATTQAFDVGSAPRVLLLRLLRGRSCYGFYAHSTAATITATVAAATAAAAAATATATASASASATATATATATAAAAAAAISTTATDAATATTATTTTTTTAIDDIYPALP